MNRCPMCDVRVMIGSRFCQSCGYKFPTDDGEAKEWERLGNMMKLYKFYWTQEEGMWDEDGHRDYDTVIKAGSRRRAWVAWFKKMDVWDRLCENHEQDPDTWIPRVNAMNDLFAEALVNEWFYHSIMDVKVELFK